MVHKLLSLQITNRWLHEMDLIIGGITGERTTQVEFAKIVNMTHSNISRLRKGEYYVTLEAVALMCKHYGVSAEYLITGNGAGLDGKIRGVGKRAVKA